MLTFIIEAKTIRKGTYSKWLIARYILTAY
jgi:hypothetical protein